MAASIEIDFGPDMNSVMYQIVDFANDVRSWHPGPFNPKLAAVLRLAEQFRPILAARGITVE